MVLNLSDPVFNFPGKNGRRDPNSNESVNQLRNVFSDFRGVLVFQVDFAWMREFIAGDTTSVEKLQNICGCPKHIYPVNQRAVFVKARFIFSGKVNQKLQAYTKEGTRSARRKGNNALSFVEEFFGFFRHIFSSFYAFGNRVGDFPVRPKDQLSASLASRNKCFIRSKNLRYILHANRFVTVSVSEADAFIDIVSCNRGLNFGNNRQRIKCSESPAVRAFIGV